MKNIFLPIISPLFQLVKHLQVFGKRFYVFLCDAPPQKLTLLQKIILTILFILFGYVCLVIGAYTYRPIVGKWLSSTARIIRKEMPSQIYIGGELEKQAKIYYANSNFRGFKDSYYILYLKDLQDKDLIYGNVVIIDLKDKDVGLPIGTNDTDYGLFLGYLLQSETGSGYIYYSDNAKGFGFDPKLKIGSRNIEFLLPIAIGRFREVKSKEIKIKLN